MKALITTIFIASLMGGFNDIAKINALKKEAKEAYNNGDYQTALKHYELLSDSLAVKDDNILLNLANAYFNVQDTTKAINSYSELTTSKNKVVRSVAHQQLGIIKNRDKQFKEALSHFKESLKADPLNEDSRYNYELLKKVLEEQEKQEQQDQNKDQNKEDQDEQQKENQQNKDQQKENQEDPDKEGEENEEKKEEGEKKEQKNKEGEEQDEEEKEGKPEENDQEEGEQQEDQEPSFSDKLKEMKISEDKARMILEAMKNNEIQYYQQNKRKAKKKKDSSKPDW